ncbi:MAG TPA: EAL domain-containing protein [Actinomycetota bacterium]|nr:EAL domain-containing protein [Actinomycetota bacterium]
MKKAQALHAYIAFVMLAGATLLVFHLMWFHFNADRLAEFSLLTLFTILAELTPLQIRHGKEATHVILSITFSFALLLSLGPLAAIFAQGSASAIDDVKRGKPIWKIGFNVGQHILWISAASAVLKLFGGTFSLSIPVKLTPQGLGVIALAGLAYFIVNYASIATAVALSEGIGVRTHFRRSGKDLLFQGSIDTLLIALAPIVAVATSNSLLLLPLIALPLAAVHKAAKVSLENAGLVESLKVNAEANAYQATHDSLTGLPNRALFHDRLQQAIVTVARSGAAVAVMLMDLDRFKEINDALGHQTGDLVLQEMSLRLGGLVREGDTIARLGGDEFALVVSALDDSAAVQIVATRILRGFDEPFMVNGMALHIGASLGIAIYPEQGSSPDVLIQRADVAMYVAKTNRTGYEYYSPESDYHSPARLELVDDLRLAINERELSLHYQPKVDFRTGRVVGVEALARWTHSKRGAIPPLEFIGLAEQSGLINPLTFHVLDRALEQMKDWLEKGIDLDVSVNLSLQSLLDLHLPTVVAGMLRKWDVPPAHLILEITESCMMSDPTRTMAILNKLNDMGVRLSVDDFGTGYSSLSYLKRLPVTELKIDKSFVMEMLTDESNAVIVRSTIDLARNLGLTVVAEGVATDAIYNTLVHLGCNIAQGFHISRPVPAQEIEAWLQRSHWGARRGTAALSLVR